MTSSTFVTAPASSGPRDVMPPCDVVTSDRCGYRDQSYDDLGGALPAGACEGPSCSRPVEPSELAGAAVLFFFVVLVGWTVHALRRLWSRQSRASVHREGVNFT